MRPHALVSLLALILLAPASAQAVVPASCPGDPIVPTQVITGELSTAEQGGYVLVPFQVPAGTTSVRVKYCHDQPESGSVRHTLDIGLYEARRSPGALWGMREFRGWGGSSHPDVTVTPQGFSTEAQYLANPRGHVPGRTTRGFLPGEIPQGEWAAELGVAAVASQAEGDADGRVAWRVEVELGSDPAFAAEPYRRARYDRKPARRRRGWYEGDLHVHAEHSALGDATMTEVFDYAFDDAGLDFVTLTDYVTRSAWGEVGRHQRRHRGKLIIRSSEVITYQGHLNNHASGRTVDYRTGPVYELQPDGSLRLLRQSLAPRELFRTIQSEGGFTQVNHPTFFPPTGGISSCRGCFWEYGIAETGWRRVDAYEVHTAFAGNPFTLTAIEDWERLRARGYDLTAVGVSDSHDAGEPDGAGEAPVGTGRTVVFARRLSVRGVRRAIEQGHAYVKVAGPDAPDLRLNARAGRRRALMGDELEAGSATLVARVIGAEPGTVLHLIRDGEPLGEIELPRSRGTFRFNVSREADYRVQVQDGATVLALTNPITLER